MVLGDGVVAGPAAPAAGASQGDGSSRAAGRAAGGGCGVGDGGVEGVVGRGDGVDRGDRAGLDVHVAAHGDELSVSPRRRRAGGPEEALGRGRPEALVPGPALRHCAGPFGALRVGGVEYARHVDARRRRRELRPLAFVSRHYCGVLHDGRLSGGPHAHRYAEDRVASRRQGGLRGRRRSRLPPRQASPPLHGSLRHGGGDPPRPLSLVLHLQPPRRDDPEARPRRPKSPPFGLRRLLVLGRLGRRLKPHQGRQDHQAVHRRKKGRRLTPHGRRARRKEKVPLDLPKSQSVEPPHHRQLGAAAREFS
mmetsp:Transcript_9716/g.31658  ORF Transcript_9716/g.31658 Transcript_9716/m.31658 type:complete len:307 (-) Transcript_9716:559-1479(-)